MGSRGPIPEPTARKRAKGVRPARINPSEPRPSRGPLEPPWELTEEAAAVWRRLVPDLARAGVITPWDLDLFVQYCELVPVVRDLQRALRLGVLVRGRRDPLVPSPAWRTYRDALALLRSLAQEYGLTPSARSGLHVPNDDTPCLDQGQEPTER
jgi:P27 family predicted phage terminase small subunit